MLYSLHIENIAIIDKSDVEFSEGFNVLTGETGAGKSIVIDSINLLLGGKSSRELIGAHGDFAYVSAVFSSLSYGQLALLNELGIQPDEDGNIIISRKISKDGKSLTKINDSAATVSLLKSAAPLLVSIHGQHDGARILNPASHIEYLDEYCKLGDSIEKYREKYDKVKALRARLDALMDAKNKMDDLTATLSYKIAELEGVKLKAGEYEELKKARAAAENSLLVSSSLYQAESILNSAEPSVLENIDVVLDSLKKISEIKSGVLPLIETLEHVGAELGEVSDSVGKMISGLEQNSYTPEYIEERLYAIETATRRYGGEAQAIDALARYKSELEKLENNEAELEKTTAEYRELLLELEHSAAELSKRREQGAVRLSKDICDQLKELDMPHVTFRVDIRRNKTSRGGNKYTGSGYDCVEFMISSNAGLEPRPISRIASGGELSRIMLCLKTTLNGGAADCSTVIYDEVDSGVSGSTAQKIGIKLKKSAVSRQVLCVTHLAQIAALADSHYKVEKSVSGGKTRSVVRLLDRAGRKAEIARIMGGLEITEQLLKTADELINNSKM